MSKFEKIIKEKSNISINLNMKKKFFIVLLLSTNSIFAQNKKEQITGLTFQLDSLQNVLTNTSNELFVKTQSETRLIAEVEKLHSEKITLETEIEIVKKNNAEVNSNLKKDIDEKEKQISQLLVDMHKLKVELNKSIEDIQNKNDIIELTNLVNEMYKWHCDNEMDEFSLLGYDSGYILGIDWKNHEQVVNKLKSANFFTEAFISNLNSIATNKDLSIKKTKKEDRKVEGVPIWEEDYDIWTYGTDTDCGGKILNDLTIKNNLATFSWFVDVVEDEKGAETIWNYYMRAKKVAGQWKIDYMEGFDFSY
jgi:hypothetical protein